MPGNLRPIRPSQDRSSAAAPAPAWLRDVPVGGSGRQDHTFLAESVFCDHHDAALTPWEEFGR